MTSFTDLAHAFSTTTPQALAAAQQRNLEALVEASRVVAAGTQTVFDRQLAAFQTAVHDGVAALQATCGATDVAAGLKTQLAFVVGTQEKTLALAAEIAEIARKTSQDALERLRERVDETTVEAVAVRRKVA